MRTILTGAKIITQNQILDHRALMIEEDRITGIVGEDQLPQSTADQVMDLSGMWLSPGFIDIHIHGGNKADTMDVTPDA